MAARLSDGYSRSDDHFSAEGVTLNYRRRRRNDEQYCMQLL